MFISPILCIPWLSLLELGPDFGSRPSYMREKLLTVLAKCGKTSSFVDDVSIVKRYASASTHAFPVSSDDEALAKARKEVDPLMGLDDPFLLVLVIYIPNVFSAECCVQEIVFNPAVAFR